MNKKYYIIAISIVSFLLIKPLSADNGKPDLWQIKNADKISYLFGSIHLGKEDLYPLSKTVQNAYSSTDYLVVEIDLKPGDEEKLGSLIQKHGLDVSRPLEQRLTPETLLVYQKACLVKKLPCEQFAPFKAWFVSVQLSVMQMLALGYDEKLGIDKHFLDLAHQSDKKIISLESAESQINIFADFTQQQQELLLVQSLEITDNDILDLLNSWKSGDDDLMLSIFKKDIEKPGAKEMYQSILDDRNFNMAAQIGKAINAGKSLFVVVGAGHMIGRNGLVELLKKDGFTLKQIQ